MKQYKWFCERVMVEYTTTCGISAYHH